ncbi:MAG TPA: BatA domain-containing protein, partial [Clostridia bacterium]
MTLNSPWSLLFLLTVPAIIVLYILKQKNQEYSISSIRLWDEVLKDIEANSPWQKLRKNLLMILQIIAMIFLVFALSGPFLDFGGSTE